MEPASSSTSCEISTVFACRLEGKKCGNLKTGWWLSWFYPLNLEKSHFLPISRNIWSGIFPLPPVPAPLSQTSQPSIWQNSLQPILLLNFCPYSRSTASNQSILGKKLNFQEKWSWNNIENAIAFTHRQGAFQLPCFPNHQFDRILYHLLFNFCPCSRSVESHQSILKKVKFSRKMDLEVT